METCVTFVFGNKLAPCAGRGTCETDSDLRRVEISIVADPQGAPGRRTAGATD
jgi:hypothetical protein